jgi:carbon monoxide dehydrogenase subunit G
MNGVVTECAKDAQLVMKYTDKMFDIRVGFQFQPSAAGTRLHHTCEIEPKSLLAKLTSPMIRSAAQKQIERDTAKLVELLRTAG